MKNNILKTGAASALALALICGQSLLGQETVQTTQTTTSAGTISEFDPHTIVVKTEDASAPIRYSYTKSTTYVDESGNPVSMETVRSGLPVTVYYDKVGDDMVASKVVVRKTVTTSDEAPPVTVKKSTTTTTTTTDR